MPIWLEVLVYVCMIGSACASVLLFILLVCTVDWACKRAARFWRRRRVRRCARRIGRGLPPVRPVVHRLEGLCWSEEDDLLYTGGFEAWLEGSSEQLPDE